MISENQEELQAVTICSGHIAPSKILFVELLRRQMTMVLLRIKLLFVKVRHYLCRGRFNRRNDADDSC